MLSWIVRPVDRRTVKIACKDDETVRRIPRIILRIVLAVAPLGTIACGGHARPFVYPKAPGAPPAVRVNTAPAGRPVVGKARPGGQVGEHTDHRTPTTQ
jgi:hypothetical protein